VPNGRGVRHRRPSSLRWPARHAASRCNTRTRSHHAAVTSDISRWCPQRPLTLGGRAVCSAGSVCLSLCWRHLRHRQVRALQLSVLARRVADVDDGHTDLLQAFSATHARTCRRHRNVPRCPKWPWSTTSASTMTENVVPRPRLVEARAATITAGAGVSSDTSSHSVVRGRGYHRFARCISNRDHSQWA
jgi:hypothetical protein